MEENIKVSDEIKSDLFVAGEEAYDKNLKWFYENGFWLTAGNERLAKAIAHWALFNIAVQGNSVAGDIIECGVFKGSSLIQFAAYRKFTACEDTRKLIAFDMFGEYQSLAEEANGDDKIFVESFKEKAGLGLSVYELTRVFEYKEIKNYEFIAGDLCDTLPKYLKEHQQLRIALLHIDVDVYKPTYACLEHAYDRVVKNGVIIFDDYRKVVGATQAIEHFFKNRKMPMSLHQLPFSDIAFMVKG